MSHRESRILVVEDERAHQLIIEKSLSGYYHFVIADSLKRARAEISTQPYDLFLLDIVLNDGTGFDLLDGLRSQPQHQLTPVIFLTVREDLESKLKGFSLGADDYVIKPADPLELRARIDAKLTKMMQMREQSLQMAPLELGNLRLDPERQAVWMLEGDQQIALDLTSLEFRLLLCLGRNSPEILTRQKILNQVWGDNTHVLDRTVDSYVAALRRKLGGYGKCIKSIHGVGYRFDINASPKRQSA